MCNHAHSKPCRMIFDLWSKSGASYGYGESVVGETGWLEDPIANNSCMALTDGLYMEDMFPAINCAAGWEGISLDVEHSPDARSYRGELLGLMAIHLILKEVHKFNSTLKGSNRIFSDCLGALKKMGNLPPYQIQSQCSHSDILKNVMLTCNDLSFKQNFSHVAAHQDEGSDYDTFLLESQLNCQIDFHVKQAI